MGNAKLDVEEKLVPVTELERLVTDGEIKSLELRNVRYVYQAAEVCHWSVCP